MEARHAIHADTKADADSEAGVLPSPAFMAAMQQYNDELSLIDVRSKEEAVAWACRWPAIDADAEIDVRQLCEPEDFAR